MKNIALDFFKKAWVVLHDTVSSFGRNKDLTSAASLAFSATLALIPALLLLTAVLGIAVGSSTQAMVRTEELVMQLIPLYSDGLLREVRLITTHSTTISVVNIVILLWIITPFVSNMKLALATTFRKKLTRPFLLEKLLDLSITVVFILGISVVAVAGVVFTLAERWRILQFIPLYLKNIAPFIFFTVTVFAFYLTFSRRTRFKYLLIGALVMSLLWFLMRPAFTLFLTYNAGYGLAFGSFKSLFVVIIWIYYSLAVFLFGAEIAASLSRKETAVIKRLIEGGRIVPFKSREKYVVRYDEGEVIFSEGEEGKDMFSVLTGSVGVQKNERITEVIGKGGYFGEMSFLLSTARPATAVALDEVELVVINDDTVKNLINEFPEFILQLLRKMATRLREANRPAL